MQNSMQKNMLIAHDNIGKVIDEINSFYGTVLKIKRIDNMYKLYVKWTCVPPEVIPIYTQDRYNHWYIDEVHLR